MTETIDDFQMIGSDDTKKAFDDMLMFPISEEWFNKALEMLRIETKIQNKVIWKVLFEEGKCSQTATGNT